jgi:hypothetical protein
LITAKRENMKTRLFILSVTLVSGLFFFIGCDGGLFSKCDPDFYFQGENAHGFELFDYNTGERLLGIQARYNRDTVKIYDEEGKIYFGGPVDLDGLMYFHLVDMSDYGIVKQHITRKLFLYLNHQEIDTLKYEFEMRKNDCGHQVYHYTKLTYNDSVYVDEYNTRFKAVPLYKK